MGDSLIPKQLYRFGPYTLDAVERVLRRDGEPVSLPPKDLETLLVLVERAGRIVEKEELLEKVWPGVFIEEGNLSRRIFNLRQVLGERNGDRPYIETIPKRGYRFSGTLLQEDPDVREGVPPPPPTQKAVLAVTGSKTNFWLWPLVVSLALAVGAILLSRYFAPSRTDAAQQQLMLAVLPFENLSGDAHEDYFADGLTEEMIAQLGQLQPAQLGVIARTSIVRYKNSKQTAVQIGRDLGVEYLVEGSVRRGGDRVRITAQLIRANEQTRIWSETYERPLTDVLDIQREIAEKITHALSLSLLTTRTAASKPAFNAESYDDYLLGLYDLRQGTRESVNEAISHFQSGITANPKDARLYSALGESYESLTTWYSSPTSVMPRVKAAATQALQLDPDLASAHVLLGDVHLFFDWDWPAAESEYRRAMVLNPSLSEAQLGYAAYLATLGRFDESLSHVKQAYRTDPLAIDSRNDALWIYYFSGRISETVEQAQKAIQIEPDAGLPYEMLALAHARLGHTAETMQAVESAIKHANSPSVLSATASALAQIGESAQAKQVLEKALAQANERYVCRFLVAAAYVDLHEQEKAFESLELGYLQRST